MVKKRKPSSVSTILDFRPCWTGPLWVARILTALKYISGTLAGRWSVLREPNQCCGFMPKQHARKRQDVSSTKSRHWCERYNHLARSTLTRSHEALLRSIAHRKMQPTQMYRIWLNLDPRYALQFLIGWNRHRDRVRSLALRAL